MFTDTMERLIRNRKRLILKGLQGEEKRYGIAIEVPEEPGEVLITQPEEIRKGVAEATSRVFLHGDIKVEEAISTSNFVFVIFNRC